MNKINRIHVAKVPYNIELDAEAELKRYLDAIRSTLEADTAESIMLDIELRTSEILAARNIQRDGLVTLADVTAVKDQLGAPEDFAAERPTRTTDSRKPKKAALGIVGLVLVLATLFGIYRLWASFGQGYQTDNQKQTYSQSPEKLVVKVDSGMVQLEVGDSDKVVVERKLKWAGPKPTIEENWVKDSLNITTYCPDRNSGWLGVRTSCSVDYVIYIPADTVVEVASGAGEIRSSGILGDLKLSTNSGEVHVDKSRGTLWVRTNAGKITGTNVQSPDVDIETHSGELDLKFAVAPQTVKANTNAGTIEIAVPKNEAYSVAANTDAGERVVDVLLDSKSSRSITANTNAGNVTVRYSK